MADPVDSSRPDDGILTAYLDGELEPAERSVLEARLAGDAELSARLEHLRRGGLAFAEAYDLLLTTAPDDRLGEILAACQAAAMRPPRRNWRLAAIAAALAIFVAGAAAGYLLPLVTGVTEPVRVAEAPGWRQVVAEYMTFITPDTLAVVPDSPAVLADALTAVGQKISLGLTPDKLTLPHVYLKTAQLLEFRGKPLAELAYLSRDDGPLAFCIIANGRPDATIDFEQREGFNIVYWTKDGLGYMLIGKAPRDKLEAYAGDLANRVS
jgi:anti-sigma factor RsiW